MYADDVALAGQVLGEMMALERVSPCTVTTLAGFVARRWGRKTTEVEREIRLAAGGVKREILDSRRAER